MSALNKKQINQRSGFTLLELMITTAVLASIAGGAIMMVGQTEESAQCQIGMVEICEIRDAFVQFRKDTGYLPKHGPFALSTQGGTVPVPADGEDWFNSPANMVQLLENPLAGTGHPLAVWNPDTKRGWRGPYLSTSGEGQVDLGSNLNSDGSGSPSAGEIIDQVVAIADPFLSPPNGNYFSWSNAANNEPIARLGRPYFAFDLNDPQNARVVSLGPNRQYDSGQDDDIVFYLFR